jgi:ribosomal protein S21
LAEIHLQDGESLESALKRFKRKVMNEEIIKDTKRHAFLFEAGSKEAHQVSGGTKACTQGQETFAGR